MKKVVCYFEGGVWYLFEEGGMTMPGTLKKV